MPGGAAPSDPASSAMGEAPPPDAKAGRAPCHEVLTALRRVARELVGVCWGSGVSNDVPALAWFLVTALVPLALGLTALAAVVVGDYAQARALSARISQVLPKDVHDQIVQRYLAALGLLLDAAVTARMQLGRPLGAVEGPDTRGPAPAF
jgi:hypothetical protein